MKKLLVLLMVLLAGTFLTGWTLTPWGSYNSGGEMLFGVSLKGQESILSVDIASQYNVNDNLLNLDSLWTIGADYGFISLRGGFETEPIDFIEPFAGFLLGVTPLKTEGLTLKGLVGTGSFVDLGFGTIVFPSLLDNMLDISMVGIIESGYKADNYSILLGSSIGYHFDTENFGLRSSANIGLWKFDISSNVLWLPVFEWDVFVKGTFEF